MCLTRDAYSTPLALPAVTRALLPRAPLSDTPASSPTATESSARGGGVARWIA